MRRALVLAVLAVGCHGDGTVPAPTSGSGDPADRRAAVERCAATFEHAASDHELTDPANVVRGCADLYREPACRAALERVPAMDPSDGLAAVVAACASAYCPRLAAPRPTLCDSDAKQAAPDDWKALDARILALELGLAPDSPAIQAVAGFLFRESSARVQRRKTGDSFDHQASIQVSLTGGDADATVGIVGGDRWPIPNDPKRDDLMPLIASLEGLPDREELQIVLVVQADTSHRRAIAVMQALRDAGFRRLAVATRPAP